MALKTAFYGDMGAGLTRPDTTLTRTANPTAWPFQDIQQTVAGTAGDISIATTGLLPGRTRAFKFSFDAAPSANDKQMLAAEVRCQATDPRRRQ
jgi:hypothetical protein